MCTPRSSRSRRGQALSGPAVATLALLPGAGPVLASGAESALGPLALLYALPYVSALVACAFALIWLANDVLERVRPTPARLRWASRFGAGRQA